VHHADIAEILDELDFEEATYIFKLLNSDKTILLELESAREYIKSAFAKRDHGRTR
jgi:magnesium transporter